MINAILQKKLPFNEVYSRSVNGCDKGNTQKEMLPCINWQVSLFITAKILYLPIESSLFNLKNRKIRSLSIGKVTLVKHQLNREKKWHSLSEQATFPLERADIVIAMGKNSQNKLLGIVWENNRCCINKQSYFSDTPLQNALQQSNVDQRSLLLKYNTNTSMKNSIAVLPDEMFT